MPVHDSEADKWPARSHVREAMRNTTSLATYQPRRPNEIEARALPGDHKVGLHTEIIESDGGDRRALRHGAARCQVEAVGTIMARAHVTPIGSCPDWEVT